MYACMSPKIFYDTDTFRFHIDTHAYQIHTYIYTYFHPNKLAYTGICTCIYIHTYMYIHTHIYVYTYINVYILYIVLYISSYILTNIHTYIHIHTYNHIYAIHTYIHAYIHTYSALEAAYSDRSIVLVSHADTLQILQTYICSSGHPNPACDSRLFHTYRFKNGEVHSIFIYLDYYRLVFTYFVYAVCMYAKCMYVCMYVCRYVCMYDFFTHQYVLFRFVT